MRTKSFSVKAVLFTAALLMLSVAASAQSKKISGTVKGEDGEPIAGVTVMIKGTTTGVATGIDGTYSLNYSQSNAIAEFSCIGYITQDVTIGNQTVINVVLTEDTQQIEETVVVGYAVGNKRTVTGSVERVTAENMNTGYVSNPIDAIRGKVPGLVITQDGGDVTAEPTIRIRGTSSLSGGNTPLVIIDGIFGDMSMLYSLSPEDIQEITVLKDASETAQYGSRGAAGVIVVTTYKGKEGTASVDYRGQFGVSKAYKTLEMLSSDEYRNVNRTMFGGAGLDMGKDTDWMD